MTSYLIVFEKELFEMVDMLEIKLLVLVWVLISNENHRFPFKEIYA